MDQKVAGLDSLVCELRLLFASRGCEAASLNEAIKVIQQRLDAVFVSLELRSGELIIFESYVASQGKHVDRSQRASIQEHALSIELAIRCGMRPMGTMQLAFANKALSTQLPSTAFDLLASEMSLAVSQWQLQQRSSSEAGLAEALIEASAQIQWQTDAQGNVVFDSPTWRRFTGQSLEQWLGFGWLEVVHPDDRERTMISWQEALRHQQMYAVEYRVKKVSGEWRWMKVRAVPQRDASGAIVRWVGMNTDITEERELHQANEDSRKRLEMALKAGGYAAWEWNGTADYWSATLFDLLGLPHDAVATTETFFNRVHSEDREDVITAWNNAVNGTAKYNTQFRIVRPNGETRWLAAIGEVDRNAQGEVTKINGLNWDITEKIEADRKLRENESFLRRILDSLFTFVAVCLPDGRIQEVNLPALTVSGQDLEKLRGVKFWDAYWFSHDADLRTRVEREFKQAVLGIACRFDLDARIGETQFLPIDFQLVPIRNSDGIVTHVVPSGTDLTDRKEAQNRLATLAALAEQSNDFIGIVNLDGTLAYLNPAGRRLLGIDDDFLKERRKVSELFFDGDSEEVAEHLNRAKQFGACARDFRFRHLQTHEPIDIYWNLFAIEDPETATTIALGTVTQDLRFRKQTELQLKNAQHLAENANKAKSQFLASMSHEIRTPMSAILGHAELLLDESMDANTRSHVEVIKRNGEYLLSIVNDVLDLSRIEANKLNVELTSFYFAKFVEDLRALMIVRCQEKSLDFKVTLQPDLPLKLRSDETKLRQVLINLLGNAIKFTDVGFVELRVRSETNLQGKSICFEVIDSGLGITEEQRTRLFRPFSQGDENITKNFGGSGLGLAISQKIMDLLGGTIEVESVFGEGSVFRVSVPILTTRLDDTVKLSDLIIDHAENDNHVCAGKHILISDDRRDVLIVTQRFLQKAGATVTTVMDGLKCLEVVGEAHREGRNFDLIVMDMQMPGLDGMEATQQIRAMGVQTPIIALTADAMKGDRERCLASGCNDYLAKPVNYKQLVAMVSRLTS